jgi:hypothetical protein
MRSTSPFARITLPPPNQLPAMRANGPDAAFAAGAASVSIPAITAIVFPCLILLGDVMTQLRFPIAPPGWGGAGL